MLSRAPKLDALKLERAGIATDDHGVPEVDPETLQCGDSAIFVAGDANGLRPVLHEASLVAGALRDGLVLGRTADPAMLLRDATGVDGVITSA